MANAQDSRPVDPGGEMKTISSETTFNTDLSRLADLESVLWRQAERVSARAKSHGLAGKTFYQGDVPVIFPGPKGGWLETSEDGAKWN